MGDEVVFKKGDKIKHASGIVGWFVKYDSQFGIANIDVEGSRFGVSKCLTKNLIKIEDEIDYDNLNEIEE